MDACDARLDIGLHDLEAVERPAETGLRIGNDRGEPVAFRAALHMFDLVGALQRPVDLPRQFRPGVGGIERLVGIHGARRVGVGGGLPAREVDGVEPGADHLHCLIAGDRAKRADRLVPLQKLPQAESAAASEAVLDGNRSAQPEHVVGSVGTADPVEASGRGNYALVKTCHGHFLRRKRWIADWFQHMRPLRVPAKRVRLS
jgi:hypothetical protein